ncbi:hypothetical protein [Sorangium sp. So ce117]|uniref:hypothetical protein n=1 Tax=Sorangium sp. So ce117 TaxID=3133277 RepID=UPI003F5E9DCC
MTFFPDLAPYRYGFAPVAWDQNGPPSLEPIELYAEVRASLRRDHLEQIFQDLVLQDRGDVVAVLTRIDIPGSSEPFARSWDVPKKALLDMIQAVHAIVSMLETSHTERALALISQRQRAR